MQVLKGQGIVLGIRVDRSLPCLPGTYGELYCTGLDDLAQRCRRSYEREARFAKWRAVLSITKGGQHGDAAI